ncbi:MAG: hypothetical protein NVS4B8_18370 [Herpetosiphon sp.]
MPAWLRDTDAPVVAPAASAVSHAADDEMPAWLHDVDASASEPVRAADATHDVADQLPDWLQGVDETHAPPVAASLAPHAVHDEMPAWMHGMDEPVVVPVANSASSVADDGLPAWLREADATASAPAPTAAAPHTAEHDLPDWLQGVEEAAPAAAVAAQTPHPSDDDLPAWLREADATASTPAPTAAAPHTAEHELPDWLQGVEEAAPAAAEAAHSPHSSDDGLPEWLRDRSDEVHSTAAGTAHTDSGATSHASVAPDSVPAVAGSSIGDSNGPAWLHDNNVPSEAAFSEGHTQPVTAALHTSDDHGLPDWLQSEQLAPHGGNDRSGEALPPWLDAPEAAPRPEPASLQSTTTAHAELAAMHRPADSAQTGGHGKADDALDLPSWLQDAAVPAATTTPEASGLPAWLTEEPVAGAPPAAHLVATHGGSAGGNNPAAQTPEVAGLPTWLTGYDEPSTPAASAPSTTSLPAWLESEPTTGTPAPVKEAFLGGLDLPAWLRDTETPAAEPVAAIAPAARVPSYLEAVAVEAPAPTPAEVLPVRQPVARSPERLESMALLQRLLDEPAGEPAPVVVVKQRSWVGIVLSLVAVVIIVGAILLILLGGSGLARRLGLPVLSPRSATPAGGKITALDPALPVLVAYDWSATRGAEMQPLAGAIIERLKAQKVPLLFMSTNPQSSVLMDAAVADLSVGGDPVYSHAGLGFINLGYKPGGVLALARLANEFPSVLEQDARGRSLRDQPFVVQHICGTATSDVRACRLDHVGMFVVLTDEQASVQAWIEQVHAVAPAVPVMFVAPAEVGPQIMPYTADAAVTVVSGLADITSPVAADSDQINAQLDATATGGAAVAVLALVGGVPASIIGYRERHPRSDD